MTLNVLPALSVPFHFDTPVVRNGLADRQPDPALLREKPQASVANRRLLIYGARD
jgi:hypothetical protein